MRSRSQVLGSAVVTAGISAALLIVGTGTGEGAGPDGKVKFGAYTAPRGGESPQGAVERIEALAGRQLDTIRDFQLWNSPYPTSYQNWVVSGGRTLLLSVKASRTNGQTVLWRDIASATPGSPLHDDMVSWAQRVKGMDVLVYVTLNHEPEASASRRMGTAEEFKSAWRTWVEVFRAQGVDNAKFNWIMTDYSFMVGPADSRHAPKWYPGDAYVDAISADAYNWFTCRPGISTAWKSLGQIIEPQRQFGLAHPDKELWLAEFGSVEDPNDPGRKAQWFADAQALFKQPAYSQYVGVNLFGRGTGCVWFADTSAASAAAWKAWGADPFYGGGGTPPPPEDGRALLVVGNPGSLGSDATVRARVSGLGYAVDVVDDSAVTASSVIGYDVVLVSQSTSTSAVNTKLRDVAVPVVVWKPYLYDDLALTASGAVGVSSRTSITVADPDHPLAAGRSGEVTITSGNQSMGWGTTLASADVVATVPAGSAIFAYRPGDALAGGRVAAACRVGLPYSTAAMGQLSADGWALFDRAVTWADDGC